MALVPRGIRLRGIYLEVVESGRLSVGDPIRVVERAGTPQ
jgi:MOSC domain-containing protein YiiM